MTTGRRGFFASLGAIALARHAKIVPTLTAKSATEAVTINMNDGGEAVAGRAICKALMELKYQTGRTS